MAKRRPNKSHKPFYGPGRPRGLDPADYLTLARMVRDGQATWEELEAKGLALPSRRKSDFRRFVEKELGSK